MTPVDTDHPTEVLQDCVRQLMPLYQDSSQDRPENILAEYPNPQEVVEALRVLIDLLLPGRMNPGGCGSMDEFSVFLMRRLSHAWRHLRPQIERSIAFRWRGHAAVLEGRDPCTKDMQACSKEILEKFFARFADLRGLVIDDIRAAYDGDPAALTYAEVQLAYPGLLAIAAHRLAHELYALDVPVLPRIMSEWTHSETGVDLHPGASIGRRFFIDHATGVVIGETTEIGDNVKIYQGVTLGAKSFPLDENGNPIKHIKRHPTVGNGVVIYANATVLGGDTVIGEGSVIGASVFLNESVPPNSRVFSQHPELSIRQGRKK